MKKITNILNPERAYSFEAISKAKELGFSKSLALVKKSGLRGRGGAGFPTGLKWELAASGKETVKYVVCNAHEGEPFTLKDQFLLENFPHLVLGGMIVAANLLDAKDIYIGINKKYKKGATAFSDEVKAFRQKGYLKDIKVNIILCENFYVGGEESALLNEIEGKRVEPRHKIPFVCNCGLFQKPTLVNNAETFANIPFIFNEGPVSFGNHGTQASPGQKLATIAGDVNEPGVYEIEMGTKLKDVIELAGGPKGKIKFVLTGGYSGTVVLPSSLTIPFEFDSISSGVALGAGTIIVYNENTNLKDCLRDWFSFYKNESCGKCTPCREGTTRLTEIISKKENKISKADYEKIDELFLALENSSFCGLGTSVPIASRGLLEKFGKELIGS